MCYFPLFNECLISNLDANGHHAHRVGVRLPKDRAQAVNFLGLAQRGDAVENLYREGENRKGKMREEGKDWRNEQKQILER